MDKWLMMIWTFQTCFTLPLVSKQALISNTVMLLKLLVTIWRQINNIGKKNSKYGVSSKIDQELNYLNWSELFPMNEAIHSIVTVCV